VCPWNKDAKPNTTSEFDLPEEVAMMTREEWLSLSQERFTRLFTGTALERRKYDPFMKNVTDVTK